MSKSTLKAISKRDFEILAFPVPVPDEHPDWQGMKLIDWFAGKVLQSSIVRGYVGEDEVAKRSYNYAEAMMRERTRRMESE